MTADPRHATRRYAPWLRATWRSRLRAGTAVVSASALGVTGGLMALAAHETPAHAATTPAAHSSTSGATTSVGGTTPGPGTATRGAGAGAGSAPATTAPAPGGIVGPGRGSPHIRSGQS
jgi:hypothetical protein